MRRSFRPWAMRMLDMERMLHPRPTGENRSELLTGNDATVQSRAKQAQAQFAEYVSGRLAIIHQNFVGRTTRFPPKIEVAVLAPDAEQQQRQMDLQQFFAGIMFLLNHQVSSNARGTSWTRRVVDYFGWPGKCIGRPHVRESYPGSGLATVDFPLMDPISCYHDFDSFPKRFFHEYVTGKLEAIRDLKQAGFEPPQNLLSQHVEAPVAVADFWLEEPSASGGDDYTVTNAILVNNQLVAEPRTTAFKHLPIIITSTHATTTAYRVFPAMGVTGSGGSQASINTYNIRGMASDELLYHAQPFYYPLAHTHRQFQQFISLLFEGMSNIFNPAILFKDPNGNWVLGPEEFGSGARVALTPEQVIEFQQNGMQGIDAAVKIFTDIINQEYNWLYNPSLLGDSTPGDSGYMLANKVSHASAILQEAELGISTFIKNGMDEVLHQFKESGLTLNVKAWEYKGLSGKHLFVKDFESGDLPDQYVLNVEARADVPQDDMAKLNYFLQGTAGGAFSKIEGRMNVLDIQDPLKTQELIDAQTTHDMPEIAKIRMLESLLGEARLYQYKAARAKRKDMKDSYTTQANAILITHRQLSAQLLGMAGGGANPNGSQPAPPGAPPEVMPPEQGVGTNPDMNAAANGQVSSYTGGRPPVAQGA